MGVPPLTPSSGPRPVSGCPGLRGNPRGSHRAHRTLTVTTSIHRPNTLYALPRKRMLHAPRLIVVGASLRCWQGGRRGQRLELAELPPFGRGRSACPAVKLSDEREGPCPLAAAWRSRRLLR